MAIFFTEQARRESAKKLFEHLSKPMNIPISVVLWDGTSIPLNQENADTLKLSIKDPGVLGTLLRWPTFENILLQYASGNIDYTGGSIFDFAEAIAANKPRKLLKKISPAYLARHALPLLFSPKVQYTPSHRFNEDETGRDQTARDNKKFIQFHYDLGNDFYRLFLDPEMLYSCAYFRTEEDSLEQAQVNKLEMICRKLRLKKGDRFLDVGSGWGALICYAAKNFGVRAHGVTLSQTQYEYCKEKIKALGLEEQVQVELRDYETLEGTYDKISSIGMYEHVGIRNYPKYFGKLCSLLHDDGILLNHGIVRRAKPGKRAFNKISPGNRLILKYIFPGSELDHIGHSIESMEHSGFEIHDVENWRIHYAMTCKLWCQRLSEQEDVAVKMIGMEKYRMWVAYLASVSLAFYEGNIRIYQTVASKRKRKGPHPLPLTRADLYL
jgi:cyclopropane-fatty-acyl-phospholipid synthase